MDPTPHKKFDLAGLRARLKAGEGKQTWSSLEELAETEEFMEFLHQEFPRETSWISHLNRRDFLKLLAAPLALAGLSACLPQSEELILPYVEAPAGVKPGIPQTYASAHVHAGFGRGALVESYEGRPTKLEGNPQHPANLGASDAFMQASILDLYDPARAQTITRGGETSSWEAFLAELQPALSGGGSLALLTETITSPTLVAQIEALLERNAQARWYQYDPVGREAARQGAMLAFEQPVATQYRFEPANVILSLDSNFLANEPGSLRYAREFSVRRDPTRTDPANLSRFYAIESSFTITGAVADHRLAIQAGQIEAFTRELARALGIEVGAAGSLPEIPAGWMEALVEDLTANPGASLVIPGFQQSPAVHALAHAINAALGNVGQTVIYTEPVEATPENQGGNLAELAQALQAGEVDTLVVIGVNPVYTAPADLNFAEAIQRAGLSVYMSMYRDETAALAGWHIPQSHPLEMWGDVRSFDGTVSIIQPLILPLYRSKSPYELLAAMLGQAEQDGHAIVQAFWQAQSGQAQAEPGAENGEGSPQEGEEQAVFSLNRSYFQEGEQAPSGGFEALWRQALRGGMLPGTALPPVDVSLSGGFAAGLDSAAQSAEGMELIFEPDPSVWDGRYANNPWLQELPKPLTKITWDNAALVSPNTAIRLDLQNEDLVELKYRDRTVTAPVWILAGLPDDSVTVHLGYGREVGSEVAQGRGFNAYALRTSDAPWFGYGLSVNKTGGSYSLATSQDHFRMEGRNLVRAGTVAQFQENPEFVREMEHGLELPPTYQDAQEQGEGQVIPQPPSLYPEHEYTSNAWGMSINLNTCIGCNACMMACVAENNIPVVGKDQVEVSREMHWIRVDRYFEGDMDNPRAFFQPVTCMHCENAPCEPVCPVNATVHDSEGINEMVYNRCIGTRYCSNNCPYKVRRFNFLQYTDEETLPLRMARNPEVTPRARGVMEKCTYCIQRISQTRIQAELEGRPIGANEVVPACAQACPTQAIVFGDINNTESDVRALKLSPLNYGLLEEIGTQPRTSYLAQLRNPNPAIQDQAAQSEGAG